MRGLFQKRLDQRKACLGAPNVVYICRRWVVWMIKNNKRRLLCRRSGDLAQQVAILGLEVYERTCELLEALKILLCICDCDIDIIRSQHLGTIFGQDQCENSRSSSDINSQAILVWYILPNLLGTLFDGFAK